VLTPFMCFSYYRWDPWDDKVVDRNVADALTLSPSPDNTAE
jgi:hypothetical protein